MSDPARVSAVLADVPIEATSLGNAALNLVRATARPKGQTYRLVNAYSIVCAKEDSSYHRLLSGKGGVNLPDGKSVTLAARLLTPTSTSIEQVRGPSFFEHCLGLGREFGLRHFFLGSDSRTLTALVQQASARFPGVEIVGSSSPPFRQLTSEERAAQDRMIQESGANVVWVGLGTPKQDFEAQRISDELQLVAVGVGAAFDFLAGTKREASPLVRRLGLEWLFRLLSEPRRLWRRYLLGNFVFVGLVIQELTRRANRRRS